MKESQKYRQQSQNFYSKQKNTSSKNIQNGSTKATSSIFTPGFLSQQFIVSKEKNQNKKYKNGNNSKKNNLYDLERTLDINIEILRNYFKTTTTTMTLLNQDKKILEEIENIAKRYEKKKEIIQKLLTDLADITKMEFKGLFTEETKEGKDLYLVFEFFNGKLVCTDNNFENHETWIIAKNLLESFEKLSEKGIKFSKNEKSIIDVFEIDINEIKINIFDLINDDIKEENEEKNGILFNIGLILDKIRGYYNDKDNEKIISLKV